MPTHPRLFDADSDLGQPTASSLLAQTGLTERHWDALAARFGFKERVTYSVLATRYGVSRARAQQLVANAGTRLDKSLRTLTPALQILESISKCLEQPAFDNLLDVVLNDCQGAFDTANWERPSAENAGRLLIVARMGAEIPKIQTWYPRFTLAACGLHPTVKDHKSFATALKRHEMNWTYERMARIVLSQAGTPLTVAEVTRRAEQLHRHPVLVQSQMARTLAVSSLFSRVGHGLYGFPFWGRTDIPSYPRLIEAALQSAGKPLSYGQLFQSVRAQRPVNEVTLRLRLERHPRFYRSVSNLFGLREWLPERRKQTLRTDPRLVEDPASLARLEATPRSGGEQ